MVSEGAGSCGEEERRIRKASVSSTALARAGWELVGWSRRSRRRRRAGEDQRLERGSSEGGPGAGARLEQKK